MLPIMLREVAFLKGGLKQPEKPIFYYAHYNKDHKTFSIIMENGV
jgi:hypothetical protein